MEKFAVKKAERFFAQKKMLVLPALELLYVWNLFKVLGKKRELIQNVYKMIEKTLAVLDAQKSKMPDNSFLFSDLRELKSVNVLFFGGPPRPPRGYFNIFIYGTAFLRRIC
jgi:hypothetical protein